LVSFRGIIQKLRADLDMSSETLKFHETREVDLSARLEALQNKARHAEEELRVSQQKLSVASEARATAEQEAAVSKRHEVNAIARSEGLAHELSQGRELTVNLKDRLLDLEERLRTVTSSKEEAEQQAASNRAAVDELRMQVDFLAQVIVAQGATVEKLKGLESEMAAQQWVVNERNVMLAAKDDMLSVVREEAAGNKRDAIAAEVSAAKLRGRLQEMEEHFSGFEEERVLFASVKATAKEYEGEAARLKQELEEQSQANEENMRIKEAQVQKLKIRVTSLESSLREMEEHSIAAAKLLEDKNLETRAINAAALEHESILAERNGLLIILTSREHDFEALKLESTQKDALLSAKHDELELVRSVADSRSAALDEIQDGLQKCQEEVRISVGRLKEQEAELEEASKLRAALKHAQDQLANLEREHKVALGEAVGSETLSIYARHHSLKTELERCVELLHLTEEEMVRMEQENLQLKSRGATTVSSSSTAAITVEDWARVAVSASSDSEEKALDNAVAALKAERIRYEVMRDASGKGAAVKHEQLGQRQERERAEKEKWMPEQEAERGDELNRSQWEQSHRTRPAPLSIGVSLASAVEVSDSTDEADVPLQGHNFFAPRQEIPIATSQSSPHHELHSAIQESIAKMVVDGIALFADPEIRSPGHGGSEVGDEERNEEEEGECANDLEPDAYGAQDVVIVRGQKKSPPLTPYVPSEPPSLEEASELQRALAPSWAETNALAPEPAWVETNRTDSREAAAKWRAEVAAHLQSFYIQYAPSMLGQTQDVVDLYHADATALNAAILAKYGASFSNLYICPSLEQNASDPAAPHCAFCHQFQETSAAYQRARDSGRPG